VGQIAKSLVFQKEPSGDPILVIASGSNRVDEELIKEYLGEAVAIADADFVRTTTGFAIGGVPPVGHLTEIEAVIDEDLFNFEEIWAAAGTPHAVFRLRPGVLAEITQGQIIRIAK
jgi:prolyl-tRNA editing enzyme YbaK/EbsC (Cys-tRNA(Pro) deacylase)